MVTIVSISSRVVRGTVGNTLSSFVLQRMGHVVRDVPTVVWDRHPGLGKPSGFAVSGTDLSMLLAEMSAKEQASATSMVTTGYFNRPEQVAAARDFIVSLRTSGCSPVVCVDPICGDAPGLYVSAEVLEALRDLLLPLADVITPNRFELGLLTGRSTSTNTQIVAAARALGRPTSLVTSAFGASPDMIGNVLVTGKDAWTCQHLHRTSAPNGTGDLMTALFVGALAHGATADIAMGRAAAGVEAILDATPDAAKELAVVAAQDALCRDASIQVVGLRT